MSIVPYTLFDFDARTTLMGEIVGLIDDAASGIVQVSPHELAEMIMEEIDRSGYVPEPLKETPPA